MWKERQSINRAMTEQACAFHPPYALEVDGESIPTGANVLPDGSVELRVYLPQASSVTASVGPFDETKMTLEKQENGLFFGAFPYDEKWRGPQDVRFQADGIDYLHPRMPAHYRGFQLVNVVEIPDPESDMIEIRDIPHGQVVRETWFSAAMGTWERMMVYLPPQYRKGGDYPTLYLQHGYSENESEWVNMGKAPYILDNLIADGKAQPMVVVMLDGMQRRAGEDKWDFSGFEAMLLEDAIPFVEENYRVKRGAEHRALAGLSMGSMQASFIGLRHPEIFGWLGLFSGFMGVGVEMTGAFANSAHLRPLTEDNAYIAKNYNLFFRSMGTHDVFFPIFTQDGEQLAQLGVEAQGNCVSLTYEGLTHDWGAFRRGLRDFAQRIFR